MSTKLVPMSTTLVNISTLSKNKYIWVQLSTNEQKWVHMGTNEYNKV